MTSVGQLCWSRLPFPRHLPRLFFMHFWANDDALKLARGIRAALDKMANAESVGRSPDMK